MWKSFSNKDIIISFSNKDINENQIEILELKNTITQILTLSGVLRCFSQQQYGDDRGKNSWSGN